MAEFDLSVPQNAYMFGFLQARGIMVKLDKQQKLQVCVDNDNIGILYEFAKICPYFSRVNKYDKSSEWVTTAPAFCEQLNALGLPYENVLSDNPQVARNISVIDYIRGIVDATASMGFIKDGFPFVSLCTTRDNIVKAFLAYLCETTGKKRRCSPSRRDNVYNLCMTREDAVNVVSKLYYDNCVCVEKKLSAAEEIKKWSRPNNKNIIKHEWTEKMDKYILSHSPKEASPVLGINENAIKARLWKLKKKDKEGVK